MGESLRAEVGDHQNHLAVVVEGGVHDHQRLVVAEVAEHYHALGQVDADRNAGSGSYCGLVVACSLAVVAAAACSALGCFPYRLVA